MSNIIQLLPDHIANQIAAGEVIQRPASVVKELMENAIDAGANQISLAIIDAGKTLIQVVDNGNGMSDEDAQLAFERHATSKIKSVDDLFALQTKGFRGEALASIAAISHVELKTQQPENQLGIKVNIEGSKITHTEKGVFSNGSSFSVKNLFYNVPARRNFLKSDSIENKHIIDEFLRIALAHPEIQFKLHSNGENIYHLEQTSNLRKRIVDIMGKSFNEKLIPVEEVSSIMGLKGYVLKPEFSRKSTGEQFLFVNNRYFKDRYFHHAIKAAFENLISPELQVSYFLYFEVDPASIDVNVHPTKTEIKFQEDRSMYAIIRSAVRQALGSHNISPTLDFERETAFDAPFPSNKGVKVPEIKVNLSYNPFEQEKQAATKYSSKLAPSKANWEDFYSVEEKEIVIPEQQLDLKQSSDEISTTTESECFQVNKRLIACPAKDGMLLIDQHRAHVRILYDDLMQQFIVHPIASQQLLFPIVKEVTPKEKAFWESHVKQIERIGFQSTWKNLMLHVTAIPAVIVDEHIENCLDDLLHRLAHQEIEASEFAYNALLSLAKTNAIKRGKILNKEEMEDIIERLFASSEATYTPEGKKIIHALSMNELLNAF